jgi:hypothetical protein
MKIKRLKLNNIGIHKELDVEFGEFTTITGSNAEGKTTIDNALIEAIEGSDIPLLSNDEESGSIEVLYDNDLSVKIPFRKDEKGSPEIRQGNMRIEKPRTQLKQWHNDARIRAIDFFTGKGAELKKYQTNTILSILKIRLNDSEIREITQGELPLEDFFNGEHPLNYIQRLVNEKDGYYYTARAKNNEGVQTIAHSNSTLFEKIVEQLTAVSLDPAFFDPEDYRTGSVVEKIQTLRTWMDENTLIDNALKFKQEFDNNMRAIESRRAEKIATESKSFEAQLGEKVLSASRRVASLKDELAKAEKEYDDLKKGFDASLESHLKGINQVFDNEVKINNNALETAKLHADKPKHNVETLQEEIRQLQGVKELLPVYDTWTKGAEEFAKMKTRSEVLTVIIERLRKLPSIILQREKLPIDGLSMNEEGEFVIINSHGTAVGLNQLSGFEKLKLSLDVSIARLGEIRMLIIPQWSEIDVDNKVKIKEYLKAKNVQGVAIEVGTGKLSIVRE